jgi:hypothetical protein
MILFELAFNCARRLVHWFTTAIMCIPGLRPLQSWDAERSPIAPLIKNCHPQQTSPLFAIPSEIRYEIFLFSLTPFQDTTAPGVPFESFGYRPSTAFPTIQAVNLLQTCKLIYLETHNLPIKLKTFVSWLLVWDDRAPYGQSIGPAWSRMSSKDVLHARNLQIYAQQCEIERHDWALRALGDPQTSSIGRGICHLTIVHRYTDFYWWETDTPMDMNDHDAYGQVWRDGLDHFPKLEKLTFELETLERRKGELNALAEKVRKWKIALKDGRVLSTDGITVQTETWIGTADLMGGEPRAEGTTTLPYYVAKVTWRAPQPALII